MALVLRWSADEMMLRSVDESPGVVGISAPEGRHTFVVDPGYEPNAKSREAGAQMKAEGRGGVIMEAAIEGGDIIANHGQMPISVDDAIAACETDREVTVLVAYAAGGISAAVGMYGPRYAFETIGDAVEWAIRVRDAAAARLG